MTVNRIKDSNIVTEAVKLYKGDVLGLNVPEWVNNPANVALRNELGDVSLFERNWRQPNTVSGHYFFVSRGGVARLAAEEMLKEIFTGDYDIEVVTGLTPIAHKGALWMNKRLGFKTVDTINTEIGDCELVMLTKEQWEGMNK